MKMNEARRGIKDYADSHRKKKKWLTIVTCLAAVVVFCTTYALILPAITLEADKELNCTYSVHEHDEACYATDGTTLICGLADYAVHTHQKDYCYDAENHLVCKLDEAETHTHTSSCYEEQQVQKCGKTEDDGAHVHTQECYETQKVLTCKKPEIILHTHTDACYEVKKDEDGNITEKNLICSLPQVEEHLHTEACTVKSDEEGAGDAMAATLNEGGTSEVLEVNKDECTPEASFRLWLHVNLYDGEKKQVYGIDNANIDDVLSYESGTETYHLIPISYFSNSYKEYGYVFDPSKKSPFRYAPSAYYPADGLISAEYVCVSNGDSNVTEDYRYYVRVQDTGTYTSVNDDNNIRRSNIYFEEPMAFEQWMWLREEDGTTSVGCINDKTKIYDFLVQTESDKTWYLIPVEYFEETYKNYGYIFDENEIDSCPFTYAPNAEYPTADLTEASYVKEDEKWYVKVQDLGLGNGYSGYPRSNLYYPYSGEVTGVEKFDLHMWVKDSSAESEYKKIDEGNTSIKNVLKRQGLRKTYYLIPVSYFEEKYGKNQTDEGYGYTFDPEDTDGCPFLYASDESVSDADRSRASYVYLDDQVGDEDDKTSGWYVQLEAGVDQSGTPSSNVYYVSAVKNTVSPAGSVINLFDYWVKGKIENDVSEKDYDSGINQDHALKFKPTGLSGANTWTEKADPYPGIVNNKLTNGYPTLTSSEIFGIDDNGNAVGGGKHSAPGTTESLDYLFDPDYSGSSAVYRETHRKVSGLLQRDSDGYYYYNSKENYAEYNEKENRFVLYNDWAVTYKDSNNAITNGQFFPFNRYDTLGRSADAKDDSMNHYFGMTLTARFIQQYGGHTDFQKKNAMKFEFSGDDDVWIFIDDVLVADLGGIHNAASVSIDFSDGKVKVNDEEPTTIKQAFADAGVNTENEEWNGDTFADDTTHTLKFFYLERGSYASNLKLMYNLKEIPASSIVKVDQYGTPVANAAFALYTAQKDEDGTYRYLLDSDDPEDLKKEYVSLDELAYTVIGEDQVTAEGGKTLKKGTLVIGGEEGDEYKGRTITPIYYGVTDEEGNMTFVDEDGVYLALADLKKLANGSSHFILREVVIPDGYRVISDEAWLYLKNSVLYCDNVYTSGAWASATAMLTAASELYLSDSTAVKDEKLNAILGECGDYVKYEEDSQGTKRVSVEYYDPEKSDLDVKGTLFAVVLKYSGDAAEDVEKQSSWTPVYGNGMEGYSLVQVEGESREAFIGAVIETARKMNGNPEYSDTVFTETESMTMQLLLSDLPGRLETYYSMLMKSYDASSGQSPEEYLNEKMQYSVAYYWTTAEDLDNATAENTFRVDPYADAEQKESSFESIFAANIEVPNLVNRLFVQKMDENGNLVNGSRFAMYAVKQEKGEDNFSYTADNGVTVYLDADTDGDGQGTATVNNDGGYTYTVGDDGVIQVAKGDVSYIITPVEVQDTKGDTIAGEQGTAVFGHRDSDKGTTLQNGSYIIREISAPDGYTVNTAEIQVLVDDTAVYANAGTEDDGVTVARGPGYVVSTLQKFASHGEIDNTLTWVYEQMLVSDVTTEFAEVYNAIDKDGNANWDYLQSYTGTGFSAKTVTGGEKNALTTHLVYGDTENKALFNYVVNTSLHKEGQATRRLYTSKGWSYYLLYQDYEYGKGHVKDGANYTDLREYGDISNLFSRSTYIQVTDRYKKLTVTKVDADSLKEEGTGNGDQASGGITYKSLAGAVFTLAHEDNGGKTRYYQADRTPEWVEVEKDAEIPVITTDGSGNITISKLLEGAYTLTEVTAPDGYTLLKEPVRFTVKGMSIEIDESGSEGNNPVVRVIDVDSSNAVIAGLLISNTAGYKLPNTGGIGTSLFTLGGLILMAGAAGWGYRLRCRRRVKRRRCR